MLFNIETVTGVHVTVIAAGDIQIAPSILLNDEPQSLTKETVPEVLETNNWFPLKFEMLVIISLGGRLWMG